MTFKPMHKTFTDNRKGTPFEIEHFAQCNNFITYSISFYLINIPVSMTQHLGQIWDYPIL